MRRRAWLAFVLVNAGALSACRREQPRDTDTTVQAAADRAYARGAYDTAQSLYMRLVAQAQNAHDTNALAGALTQAGLASWHRGRYADARTLGERALAIKISTRSKKDLAKSYNALGLLAHNEGRFSQAIDAFDHAERAALEVGDSAGVAKARGNRGLVYSDIGDFRQARSGISALRDFARAKADTQLQGNALVNLGMLEIRAGAPSKAMPLLTEGLQLERAAHSGVGEENALGQIGTAYQAMGEPQLAIAYLDSALHLAHEQGLRQPETDDLQLLAQYYAESGDPARSLALLNRAASLADSLGMRNIQGHIARAQARALLGLYDFPGALRRAEAARDFHAEAGSTLEQMEDDLAIAELAERAGNAGALDTARAALAAADHLASSLDTRVARVEVGLGKARVAAIAKEPLAVLSALGRIRSDVASATTGREWEASALESSASLSLGRLDDAVHSGREAVRAIERVRAQLTSGPLRTSFTADRSSVYETLLIALLRKGDTAEAFKVADAARSRALLEHLSALGHEPQRQSSAADLVTAEGLLRRIDKLVELLRVADNSDDQRAFLSRQLTESRRDYETVMRRASIANHPSAGIMAGDIPDVSRVRAALGADEAILEYFAADTELVVFVVDARRIRALEVPIGDKALSSRIRLARELLGRRESVEAERKPVLAGLYELLIAPVRRAHLLDNVHTIAVVPHAALAYLPFAALIDPETGRYLVQSFDLLELPSASALSAVRQESSRADGFREAAVFAPFPAELPGTRAEAEALSQFGGGVHQFVGSVATESAVRRALSGRQIVHVATHGVLNARAPMFSRIELARPAGTATAIDDGRLEVHEVLDLTIQSPLVFLSGCETGSGVAWSTSFTRGEDYATLAEAFLYAGAQNVISTLWRIEDLGAARFASTFYDDLKGRSPVEALATAQRAMLSRRDYASPYYWSAYIVSGDGRSASAQNRPVLSVIQ